MNVQKLVSLLQSARYPIAPSFARRRAEDPQTLRFYLTRVGFVSDAPVSSEGGA